jgi:hypothetical protein
MIFIGLSQVSAARSLNHCCPRIGFNRFRLLHDQRVQEFRGTHIAGLGHSVEPNSICQQAFGAAGRQLVAEWR